METIEQYLPFAAATAILTGISLFARFREQRSRAECRRQLEEEAARREGPVTLGRTGSKGDGAREPESFLFEQIRALARAGMPVLAIAAALRVSARQIELIVKLSDS